MIILDTHSVMVGGGGVEITMHNLVEILYRCKSPGAN